MLGDWGTKEGREPETDLQQEVKTGVYQTVQAPEADKHIVDFALWLTNAGPGVGSGTC